MDADVELHGTIWRDCNEAHLPHRWQLQQNITFDGGHDHTYWQCQRAGCSVITLTYGDRPTAYTRGR